MNPGTLDSFDVSYLLHRQEIVFAWPDSPHRTALLAAIDGRLESLLRRAQ